MGRKTKHPWEEIRLRFVQGDPTEEGGRTGHHWPTTGDLAREYSTDPATVSKKANACGPGGKTWYEQREAFKRELQQKLDDKTTELLAGQAAGFRARLFQVSVRVASGVDRSLRTDDPSPAGYNQLVSAAARAEKLGESILSKVKAEDPKKAQEEMDDWTLMRHIHAGAKLEDLK